MNTRLSRLALVALLFISSVFSAFGASLNVVESAKSYAATGYRGCVVSGATVATPSVVSCVAAHRLADGDPIQITAVGGTTTINTVGYAKVTGQSATTFAFYSDAALSTGITGTGSYTSGGQVSSAFDISGMTGDWTLRFRIESLTAAKKVLVAVEESADGFASDIRQLAVFSQLGSIGTSNNLDTTIRAYQLPSARFGVSNARIRLKVQAIDGSATVVSSLFIEN